MTDMTTWHEPAPETAIEIFQNRAVERLTDWATSANAAHKVATNLANTSFVPTQLRGKPMEITAAILSGLELGMSPMRAIQAFDVIQGQAAPRAITLRAILQSLGHEIKVKESTGTRAVVLGRRRGDTEWQSVTWTIDRAKQLGLTGKDNWKKQPQAMLIARATSELARLIAADAILGIPYTLEEIADGIEGATLEPTTDGAQEAPEGKVMRRAPRKPAKKPEPVAEPETVEPDPGEAVTDAQVKKIMAQFGEVGRLRDLEVTRDNRLSAYTKWTGRPIGTTHDLTKAEAVHVVDRLDSWIADLVAAADTSDGELVQAELIDDEVQS